MEGVWRILSTKMNEIIHIIQSMLTGKTLKNFRQISYFLEIWLVGKLWVHTRWSLLWIVTWLVVVRCISYNGDVPRLEGTSWWCIWWYQIQQPQVCLGWWLTTLQFSSSTVTPLRLTWVLASLYDRHKIVNPQTQTV